MKPKEYNYENLTSIVKFDIESNNSKHFLAGLRADRYDEVEFTKDRIKELQSQITDCYDDIDRINAKLEKLKKLDKTKNTTKCRISP